MHISKLKTKQPFSFFLFIERSCKLYMSSLITATNVYNPKPEIELNCCGCKIKKHWIDPNQWLDPNNMI